MKKRSDKHGKYLRKNTLIKMMESLCSLQFFLSFYLTSTGVCIRFS